MTDVERRPGTYVPETPDGSGRVLRLLPRFLLVTAAATFGTLAAELWFGDHTGETLQLLPFAACAIGLIAIGVYWAAPGRATFGLLAVLMAIVTVVSMLGLYEHIHANYSFERAIRPNDSAQTAFGHALHGAVPLLAPGSLSLPAVLAVAGAWPLTSLKRKDD